jgi:Zn-dependent protease with chaperone function
MSGKSLESAVSLASLAAVLLCVQAAMAQGIYEPVALKPKEYESLIVSSRQLRGYFEERSLLFTDPGVQELVARVGASLAPRPTDDYMEYHFFVLRDPSPNAFALPNGDIYVHTGMLARLTDTAQLAAVLGHELNHVAGHHGVVDLRASNKKIIAGMVLGGVFGGVGAVIQAGLYTSMYGFSRELEQEADDRAVGILEASPYDAHAIPEIYELLAKDYEGERPRIATIWSTHPQLEARAARTRDQVADAPAGRRDAGAFDEVIMPVRTMTIRDYVQDDYPRTAVALAEDLAARYPREPQLLVLVGDAWAAMGARSEFDDAELSNAQKRRNANQRVFKTRQEREQALLATPEGKAALAEHLAKAREAYMRTISLSGDFAPAYRGLGEVAERLGEPRDAAQAYVDYLKRAPDADDRTVILQRLRALRDVLRTEETHDESTAR